MQAERPDTERGARAVLVALQTGGLSERGLTASLDELARLLETAGGVEAARVVQNAPSADPRTYIGSGKAKEIAEFIRNDGGIDLVVFDNELTPSQIRNLEDIFDVRVIDRTMLILDIFALHAVTGEGKLQVEIACLRYSAPRLTGKGKSLSRQGGTSGPIGSRGPGESKLELDRRRIRERISALNAELKDIEKTRAVNRSQRTRAGIPTAAIVGYTNAGKSTLLNRLTDAGILAEDKLFATLDPTTRRLSLPRGGEILLTDTVGLHRPPAYASGQGVQVHARGGDLRRHHRSSRRCKRAGRRADAQAGRHPPAAGGAGRFRQAGHRGVQQNGRGRGRRLHPARRRLHLGRDRRRHRQTARRAGADRRKRQPHREVLLPA